MWVWHWPHPIVATLSSLARLKECQLNETSSTEPKSGWSQMRAVWGEKRTVFCTPVATSDTCHKHIDIHAVTSHSVKCKSYHNYAISPTICVITKWKDKVTVNHLLLAILFIILQRFIISNWTLLSMETLLLIPRPRLILAQQCF